MPIAVYGQAIPFRADVLRRFGIPETEFELEVVGSAFWRIGFKATNAGWVTLDMGQAAKLAADLQGIGDDELADLIIEQVRKAVRYTLRQPAYQDHELAHA